MIKSTSDSLFTMTLPVGNSGIFKQGYTADELKKIEVVCKQQNEVENGSLAAVTIKNNPKAILKRIYKNTNGYVLEEPKNLDFPDMYVEPIVLTTEEASREFTILGKVVKFCFSLS